jgi:hypothetical protein
MGRIAFRSIVRGVALSLFGLSALGIHASAQAPGGAAPLPRIITPVASSRAVELPGHVHPWAQPRFDRGPVPDDAPMGRMLLVLKRSPQQQQALARFLAEQAQPSSPNFHKWLTPDQFGRRFGVADADIETVTSYLSSQGFTVSGVAPGRMAVEFTGTAGQVKSAFGAEIHTYRANGQTFHANAANPRIPAALLPVVAGVASLNNYRSTPAPATLQGQLNPATHKVRALYSDSANDVEAVTPGDLAAIYNIPATYNGTGVSVGVLGDSNINLAYIASYQSTFGLPANPPTVVVDGNDPGVTLDAVLGYEQIELIDAVAPRAAVRYYVAEDTDYSLGIFLAALRAVDDNAVQVLSVGYESCEQALGPAGNALINALWEQAAAQGITVLAEAGSGGSADCDVPANGQVSLAATQGLAVNGFASTPWDTAVGATDFYYGPTGAVTGQFTASPVVLKYWNSGNTGFTSAKGYVPEQAWNASLSSTNQMPEQSVVIATGSGLSRAAMPTQSGGLTGYPLPYWQVNAAARVRTATRVLPDVTFFGGIGQNGSAYVLCAQASDCNGGGPGSLSYTLAGGTTGASAAFSGVAALLIQAHGVQGYLNPTLYSVARTSPTVLHDIAFGTSTVNCANGSPNCTGGFLHNSLGHIAYLATAGFDAATGLGSVNVGNLIANWSAPNTSTATVTLSLTRPGTTTPVTAIHHGDPVQVNINVSGATGTPTGQAAIYTTSPSAPVAAGQSVFTLSNGSAVDTSYTLFPGGTYQVTARYQGDQHYAAAVSAPVTLTVYQVASQLIATPVNFTPGATLPYGTPVTVDIRVSPAGGNANQGMPTGSVIVQDNGRTITEAPLSAQGIATFSSSTLPRGGHSLYFLYSGDVSFSSSSAAAPIGLSIGQTGTTTALSASVPQAPSGDTSFDLIANVTAVGAADNGAPPAGHVNFYLGGKLLGSGPLLTGFTSSTSVAGVANLSIHASQLAVGNNTITATFISQSGNYLGSTSAPLMLANGGAAGLAYTVTTVNTTPPGVTQFFNYSEINLTASVSGGGTPTGTVNFYANGAPIGSAPVANGIASFAAPFNGTLGLPLGANTITAQYAGDTTHAPSDGRYYLTIYDGSTAPDFTVQVDQAYQGLSSSTPAANYRLQFTSLRGFATGAAISLAYNVPAGLACSGSPAAPNFGSSTYAAVAVQCTFAPGYAGPSVRRASAGSPRGWWLASGGATLACLLFFGIPAQRRSWQAMLGAVLVAVVSLGMTACSSANSIANQAGGKPANAQIKAAQPSASGGTVLPAGTYTVTVTASAQVFSKALPNSSTTISHSLPLEVVVQ